MFSQIFKRVLSSQSHLKNPNLSFSISILFFSSSSQPRKHKPKSTTAVSEYLINQHQFSPEAASKASSAVSHLKNPQRSDSVLSFLRESGFSQSQLEETIKKLPRVLSSDVDKSIRPKFKIFQDLGLSPSDIADIISSDPWILWYSSDNRFGPSISVLKNILGSDDAVCRALKLSGWFLKIDLEKSMVPNIEFLKSCGVGSSAIFKFVFKFPRFLMLKHESMVGCVRRADEMGFDRKSKMFLPAIRVLSSMSLENWGLKLDVFRSLGFSENDILAVFRRVPLVFGVSKSKIKDMTELLLLSGNHDISFVVNHPELLLCSPECRLKPRLKVLQILEDKRILKKKPSLTTVCKITDKLFSEKYVLPYANELQLEEQNVERS